MTTHQKLSQFSALAASAATLGVSGGAALAADLAVAPDKEWKVSVEGGFLWADLGSTYTGFKLGYTPGDDAEGGYGAFSVGRDISDTLDWRLSAAFTAFEEAVNNLDLDGTPGFTEEDFDHQTVDFDIGKNYVDGLLTWRLFGGLSFAHIESSSATATLDEDFPVESDQKDEFFGIGPRIGGDFLYGQTYGLAGSFSAAIYGGTRDSTGSYYFEGDLSDVLDEEDTVWIGNLRASLGVFAKPGENTTFTVGYRVDAWVNARDESFSDDFLLDDDVVTHGPFVKVATEF